MRVPAGTAVEVSARSGDVSASGLSGPVRLTTASGDEYHQLINQQQQTDAQLAARSAECTEMLDRVLKHKEPATQEFDREQ